MIQERRKISDRRNDVRYVTQIKIAWEGLVGRQSGMVCDISETGCFVLCSGAVKDGEKISLYFPAGRQQSFELLGEIITHYDEIGYAVRFTEMDEIERLFLKHLIKNLAETEHSVAR